MIKAFSHVAWCALFAIAALGAGSSAQAEEWAPQHNVEFIVPTAAGSTMDLLARVIQKIWDEQHAINASMTVEAKAGAGGAVAWTYVSRRVGDGHVIAISGPTLLANDILHVGELHYGDVTPIAQLFNEYVVFAVRSDEPIKTGADLVAAMRTSKTLSIGVAPGFGGSNHVAVLKLARAAHIDPNNLTIAPFKGANEAVNNLLGGHVDVTISTVSAIAPFVKAGRLRAIAVAAPSRLSDLNVPTWRELGYDVTEGNWRGIVGPKNLDRAEIAYWDKRVAELVKTQTWAEMLKRYGWDADYADSVDAKRFLDARYQELKSIFADLKMSK